MAYRTNCIAALLDLPTAGDKTAFRFDGAAYELYHADAETGTAETLYRTDAPWGVGNAGFSLVWTPMRDHAMALGQHLARKQGVGRAAAEQIVAEARAAVTRIQAGG